MGDPETTNSGEENLPDQPSKKNKQGKTNALISLFECPVCYDHVKPPIIQCENGHRLCFKCRGQLSNCPICRKKIQNIRNEALEQVADFPCRYHFEGCTTHLLISHKLFHENHCEYRPISCPLMSTTCSWEGAWVHVFDHLKEKHFIPIGFSLPHFTFLATASHFERTLEWVSLFDCFENHFMVYLRKIRNGQTFLYYAGVQIFAPHLEAIKFVYQVTLKKRYRTLTWEAVPQNVFQPFQAIKKRADCLVFGPETVELFTSPSDYLALQISIKKNLYKDKRC